MVLQLEEDSELEELMEVPCEFIKFVLIVFEYNFTIEMVRELKNNNYSECLIEQVENAQHRIDNNTYVKSSLFSDLRYKRSVDKSKYQK